jgi:hypothetical protein
MALFLSACALALQAASAAASGNADPTVPPIRPSPARDEAMDIVARLSPDEKYSILNGIGYAQGAYHNLDGWVQDHGPPHDRRGRVTLTSPHHQSRDPSFLNPLFYDSS